MKRGVKVPGRPGCCRSGCCRSLWFCVRWSVLVLGAVVWSSCRVWSSGPVSGLVPGTCFFLFLLKRGFCPGNRPQDRFFDRYPLLQPGQLRFTWPWDLWLLQFFIFFLFSVCSDRCRIIQTLRRPLSRLLRQRPFPFDKLFNGPSVIPEGDARA